MQLAPLQRCHCRAKLIGAVPDQLPSVPDNVCPTCAVPDTTGNTEFTGGDPAAAVTAPV